MWVARHPLAAITEFPWLWDPVARFTSGLQEMTGEDWKELSAIEFEAKLAMASALNRKLERGMKPEGNGDDK